MRDDDKYVQLIQAYKVKRLELGPEANLYLKAAQNLRKLGQVSEEVIKLTPYV